MIICFDGLLSMYSDNPLITWSCKIMWQTKVIISSLSKCLWQGGNLPWWAAVRKVTSSFNYVVLCYKLKIIISPLQYIYGHKPRQAGDLPSEASTYNVAPTFALTWPCEITWQTENICWLPECVWPQNVTGWWLHDCIIMWSLRSRDTVK